MEIIPAIDLKGGKCVRLTQGRFDATRQYSDDPLMVAKRWRDEGAKRLHLVDLDGARTGSPSVENVAIVKEIVRQVGLPVQLGGGIRNADRARRMIELGVSRVIIGTAAVSDPLVGELFAELGEQAILGLDAVGGMVAIEGWQQATQSTAIAFAQEMQRRGVVRIIFTDIARDGMLEGPNIPATQSIQRAVSIPVIASGGVGNIDHIRALATTGVEAVIVGKSLYEGTLSLSEAIAAG